MKVNIATFSIMTLSIECRYAKCRDYLNVILSFIMLIVIMLSVVRLNVVMMSDVMLSVVMFSVAMLSVAMLSVAMLSVAMLSVVMLNVVMLSVVAPRSNLISHKMTEYTFFDKKVGVSNFYTISIKLGCFSMVRQFRPSLIFEGKASVPL